MPAWTAFELTPCVWASYTGGLSYKIFPTLSQPAAETAALACIVCGVQCTSRLQDEGETTPKISARLQCCCS